jgi:hypothetical protein
MGKGTNIDNNIKDYMTKLGNDDKELIVQKIIAIYMKNTKEYFKAGEYSMNAMCTVSRAITSHFL